MRDLKFRAWHPALKCWVYFGNPYMICSAYSYELRSNAAESVVYHCWDSKDEIIQQYTGCKDKNGKEIYEGDIVKTDPKHITLLMAFSTGSNTGKLSEYTKGEVKWLCEAWKVCQEYIGATHMGDYSTCDCCPCGLEVIGNIVENKQNEKVDIKETETQV
jgi:uncharacterized phage protein (TIGR01671 family)